MEVSAKSSLKYPDYCVYSMNDNIVIGKNTFDDIY